MAVSPAVLNLNFQKRVNVRASSPVEVIAKPWNSRFAGPIPHTSDYYRKCMVGGVLSCGITHAAMTPLDVTKCNIQTDPKKYRGLVSGLRTIVREEGARGVLKGFTPTLLGYSAQGLFKFGLYEVFKDIYSNVAGKENAEKYRGIIWCMGSASAEFFADIALCPMEMVKIKMQTSPAGTWPVAFGPALAQMRAQSVETRFPFGSLTSLWLRQVPYTIAKFFFFEEFVSLFYNHVLTDPKESYSKTTQLGVTFASGYSAGIICALVSQPADNLVSQLGKTDNKGKGLKEIARNVGIKDLMLKGMGTRILMVGSLTALQWYIYDAFKTIMGLETTGSK